MLTLETKVNNLELVSLAVDAISELKRACGKFPTFPHRIIGEQDLWTSVKEELEQFRSLNDSEGGKDASGSSVFFEEFFEFVQAVEKGDAEAARAELVQAMAMLMRIHCHLGEYCQAKEAAHG
jgi:NTP pyrophosphatase (non-canonical NTP hydrolase)